MDHEILREMLHKSPFHPFGIVMDNGRAYPVPHPDYLLLAPTGDRVVVDEDTGRLHILDVPHISNLTVVPRRKSRPKH